MTMTRKSTDREVLMLLREFYWAHGRMPKQKEMNTRFGLPSYGMVSARFGNASEWPAAMEKEFGPNWREPEGLRPAESGDEIDPALAQFVKPEEPVGTLAKTASAAAAAELGVPTEDVDVKLVGTVEVSAMVGGRLLKWQLHFDEKQ